MATKNEVTLEETVKKVGLDVYKAVSGNLESLRSQGKINDVDSNTMAKQITDWTKRQIVENWVDREEVRRYSKL